MLFSIAIDVDSYWFAQISMKLSKSLSDDKSKEDTRKAICNLILPNRILIVKDK